MMISTDVVHRFVIYNCGKGHFYPYIHTHTHTQIRRKLYIQHTHTRA